MFLVNVLRFLLNGFFVLCCYVLLLLVSLLLVLFVLFVPCLFYCLFCFLLFFLSFVFSREKITGAIKDAKQYFVKQLFFLIGSFTKENSILNI